MYNYKKLIDKIFYIGASDRRISLFESTYPVPLGMSYNSYFADGDETLVLDTVDSAVADLYFENIAALLNGRKLDYVIINHMEPDHSAALKRLIQIYPDIKIICNAKSKTLIEQFCGYKKVENLILVNDGDTLKIGNRDYTFIMAPMVHWPEVMVTYDSTDKILYSADAFGTFGALSGNIFDDEVNFFENELNEARRYYTNIVGKYGPQVKALLKKAEKIDIKMICPLHGYIFRSSIAAIINYYSKWSTYTPEENSVLIAYASIYGNTANACDILATKLSDRGIKVKMYDISVTHYSEIISQAFKHSHIVLAAPTYNGSVFTSMDTLLSEIKNHNLQNRTFAFIENGSWGPLSGKIMRENISTLKNVNLIENTVTLKSSVNASSREEIVSLSDKLYESLAKNNVYDIEPNAMFKLSYGLFVLTAKGEDKNNACILNTVTQVTDNPKRITIAINKSNLTHDLILKNGQFNVSVLSTDAPFSIFEQFGFKSGRDVDKFKDINYTACATNGILYLTEYSNALISAKVISFKDLGTHTEFLAEITEAKLLSNTPSMTYQYYFDNVKPKPIKKKKGFVCKICGYVYEGETLPDDFVCPLCKHPASDFEPLD